MRRSQLTGQKSGGQTQYDEQTQLGEIRNPVTYQRPIDALYEGKPVTLIGFGDISGMSAAEKFVDENGHIDWAPSEEFSVTDRNVVPQTVEQWQRLRNATTASGLRR